MYKLYNKTKEKNIYLYDRVNSYIEKDTRKRTNKLKRKQNKNWKETNKKKIRKIIL